MAAEDARPSSLYETVAYPPLIHPETHPDRMAVTARLLGLETASPESCRVLDLGCGIGSNLIAMAELLPKSRFIGIDLAENQVRDGQATAARLGLANIEFRQADIMDLKDGFDEFDYIIAHGVYAWVPVPVRQKMLRLIRGNLAPRGIAYVSYAAYPGAYPMQAVRDIMLYRTRDVRDTETRAKVARDFIAFLAASFAPEAGLFGEFVRQYAGSFLGREGAPEPHVLASLTHDELAEINEPVYFHEFAAKAEAAGLQYLAEVDLRGSTPIGLRPETVEALGSFPRDLIETEQYLDFIRNRGFRRTLLCRPDAVVERSLAAGQETLAGLYLASSVEPARRRTSASGSGVVRFISRNGLAISMDYPLTTAALLHLGKVYPRAVKFEDLLEVAGKAVYGRTELKPGDASTVASDLLQAFLFGRSLLELYVSPRPLAVRPGRRPRTPAFARELASQRLDAVPNLRHEPIRLGSLGTKLLPFTDGGHTAEEMAAAVGASPAEVGAELRWLGRAGMLIG